MRNEEEIKQEIEKWEKIIPGFPSESYKKQASIKALQWVLK